MFNLNKSMFLSIKIEIKSFTDCFNFIDNMILYNVEKVDSMDGLESMRDFVLDDYIEKVMKSWLL